MLIDRLLSPIVLFVFEKLCSMISIKLPIRSTNKEPPNNKEIKLKTHGRRIASKFIIPKKLILLKITIKFTL